MVISSSIMPFLKDRRVEILHEMYPFIDQDSPTDKRENKWTTKEGTSMRLDWRGKTEEEKQVHD